MDNENSCMLKEITSFLIRVGEHCLSCEKKTTIETEKQVKKPTTIKIEPKPELPQKPKKEGYVHNVKKSYLEKWITNGSFEVFTLKQFYKVFPKQRENKHLARNILRLIESKKIAQLDKDKYMVKR